MFLSLYGDDGVTVKVIALSNAKVGSTYSLLTASQAMIFTLCLREFTLVELYSVLSVFLYTISLPRSSWDLLISTDISVGLYSREKLTVRLYRATMLVFASTIETYGSVRDVEINFMSDHLYS